MFGSVPKGHTSGAFYNQDENANNPNQNHIGIDFHSLCLFLPVRIKYLLYALCCMNSLLPQRVSANRSRFQIAELEDVRKTGLPREKTLVVRFHLRGYIAPFPSTVVRNTYQYSE